MDRRITPLAVLLLAAAPSAFAWPWDASARRDERVQALAARFVELGPARVARCARFAEPRFIATSKGLDCVWYEFENPRYPADQHELLSSADLRPPLTFIRQADGTQALVLSTRIPPSATTIDQLRDAGALYSQDDVAYAARAALETFFRKDVERMLAALAPHRVPSPAAHNAVEALAQLLSDRGVDPRRPIEVTTRGVAAISLVLDEAQLAAARFAILPLSSAARPAPDCLVYLDRMPANATSLADLRRAGALIEPQDARAALDASDWLRRTALSREQSDAIARAREAARDTADRWQTR